MNTTPPACLGGLVIALWLTLGGCAAQSGQNPISQVMDRFTPPTPGEVARDAFNVYDPDRRRQSVNLLAASQFGGEEPYLRMYRLLIDDDDPTVRAACTQALALHGDTQDVPLLLRRLDDSSALVRWEAAKALQRIHSPQAPRPLTRTMLNDSDTDVRQAAAAALGQYADPAVFQALIGALDDRSYSVVHAAYQSLKTLTGYDFGTDASQWMLWGENNQGRLFRYQQPYVYQPYQAPPTLMDRARFWKERQIVQPQTPVGLEPDADTPDRS